MTRSEGFAAVPTWMIRDTDVSVYAINVYAALASRAGLYEIHPSQGVLAREARCSERKVRDALRELEALGVVERVKRRSERGRATDAYTLHPNGRRRPVEVPARDAGTGEVPAPGDVGSGTSEQTTPLIEVDREVDRASEIDTPDPFDDFYLVYPRKVGKEGARKAFARAARSTDPGVIIAGARRFAADPNLPEKQFIPHPATWLNQGRWDDEPLPPRAGQYQPDSDEFGQDEWMYRS